jgi:hypothetical protein
MAQALNCTTLLSGVLGEAGGIEPIRKPAARLSSPSRTRLTALPEGRENRASLISDHQPIVLLRQLPGMGRGKRYIVTIADDDRRPLNKLCEKTQHCRWHLRRDAQRIRPLKAAGG